MRRAKPKRVLEVGTLIGYSAILIGKELDDDAQIITVQMHVDKSKTAEENIGKASIPAKIKVLTGDAVQVIPQLKDVFDYLGLKTMVKPFTRCMECNGLIEEVSKEMIQDRLQPNTMLYYDRFFLCRQCDHVYWEGSHFKRMKEYVDKLVRNC